MPTAGRVKEALFAALGGAVPGAQVLDGYAGSGALGIEALSRGAAAALFVDRDAAAVRVVRANLAALGLAARGRARRGAVEDVLRGPVPAQAPFDLVLLDPPYDQPGDRWGAVLDRLDAGWLAAGGLVVLERRTADQRADVPGPAWRVTWERTYGDTLVTVAARRGG